MLRTVRVSTELMQAANVVRLLRIIGVSGASLCCGRMSCEPLLPCVWKLPHVESSVCAVSDAAIAFAFAKAQDLRADLKGLLVGGDGAGRGVLFLRSAAAAFVEGLHPEGVPWCSAANVRSDPFLEAMPNSPWREAARCFAAPPTDPRWREPPPPGHARWTD